MRRFFTTFFFNKPVEPLPNWQVVFRTMLDFEAEILKATLADAGIESVLFTKRDRMFSFFTSEQPLELWVRAEMLEEASRIIVAYQQQSVAINALTKEQSN
ncbi:MAG: putative signal transducing protein [Chlorobiales bacterium]